MLKRLKHKPIFNSVKSNGKYVFSLIHYPRQCPAAEAQTFYFEHTRRLRSCDYSDVNYGKAEFNAIFLRLR